MHSIICKEAGNPDGIQIVETSIPRPRKNQVRIKVMACALSVSDFNPFFEKAETGKVSFFTKTLTQNKPFGGDVSGIITETGKNVTSLKVGDEVYTSIGVSGGCSEYVTVNADRVFRKPCNLSFEEAAAIPTAGIVAMEACKKAEVSKGKKFLIYGASGGVGQFALQIAKAMGATVTAVCSTRNVERAYAMGADEVIDYKKEDIADRGTQFDVILGVNGSVPLATYKKMLKTGGTYVAIGGKQATAGLISPIYALGSGKRMTFVLYALAVNHRHLNTLKDLAEKNKIKPYVEAVYRPADLKEAFVKISKNHAQGKIVVRMEF